jgi:hypothetical protein
MTRHTPRDPALLAIARAERAATKTIPLRPDTDTLLREIIDVLARMLNDHDNTKRKRLGV